MQGMVLNLPCRSPTPLHISEADSNSALIYHGLGFWQLWQEDMCGYMGMVTSWNLGFSGMLMWLQMLTRMMIRK